VNDDLPDLPEGFQRVSGKRAPPEGEWFIQLRCGFVDRRIAYTRSQLVWKWTGGSGDVVAVCKAAGSD
jgi:hypothetical protein